MGRNLYVLSVAVAVSLVASTQAWCGNLSDLPANEQQLAHCMASATGEAPGVTDAQLEVSDEQPTQVFITYTYKHRYPTPSPTTISEKLKITDLISGKQTTISVGGLLSPPDHKESEQEMLARLDDSDAGIYTITGLWEKRCGLKLSVLSV